MFISKSHGNKKNVYFPSISQDHFAMSEQQPTYPDINSQGFPNAYQYQQANQVALEVVNKPIPPSSLSWGIPGLLFGAPISAAIALRHMIGDNRDALVRVVKYLTDNGYGVDRAQDAVANLCLISPGILKGSVIFGAGLALSYAIPNMVQRRGFGLNVKFNVYSTQLDTIKHVALKVVRTFALANVAVVMAMPKGQSQDLSAFGQMMSGSSLLWWIYESISYMSD